jgi:hypothetical protein
MFGSNPFGDLPLGDAPYTNYVINESQTLTIIQFIALENELYTPQSLGMSDTIGVVIDAASDIIRISQVLLLDQSTDAIVFEDLYDVSQSLTLVQSAVIPSGIVLNVPVSQSLSLVQSVTYDKVFAVQQYLGLINSNPKALIDNAVLVQQTLPLVQSIGTNQGYAITVPQTLTLTQLIQTVQDDLITQSLSLSQTVVADLLHNTIQSLPLTQAISVAVDYATTVPQSIQLNDIELIIGPGFVGQELNLQQTLLAETPYRFTNAHELLFTQTNSLVIGTSVQQSLALTQLLVTERSNNLAISQQLTLNDVELLQGPEDVGQGLFLTQTVSVSAPMDLPAVNQTLTLTQSNSILSTWNQRQQLNLTHQNTYTKLVDESFTHPMTFVQSVVFSRAVSVAQTLSLSQGINAQVPFNISESQTLTLTDSIVPVDGISVTQLLPMTQEVFMEYAGIEHFTDTLDFVQWIDDDEEQKNIGQNLLLRQVCQFGYGLTTDESLTLSQVDGGDQAWTNAQALVFTQTAALGGDYHPTNLQTLFLEQAVVPHVDYIVTNIQTLNIRQRPVINSLYNYLLCDCLKLKQTVTNAVPLEVSQFISFYWTEKEIQYQTLLLTQLIQTNYDDVDCCNPYGYNPDKDTSTPLVLAQDVGCAMTYNLAIAQSLNVRTATAWRV